MTAADVRRIALSFEDAEQGSHMGATHIRLAEPDEAILTGALRTAWTLRVDKNAATRARGSKPRPRPQG